MKILIPVLLLILFSNLVIGAIDGGGGGGSFDEVKEKVLRILGNIIRFLFSALMLISGGLLIYLGIRYITAGGKVEELHQSLLYLVLGIIVLILSLFLPNVIKNFIESLIK